MSTNKSLNEPAYIELSLDNQISSQVSGLLNQINFSKIKRDELAKSLREQANRLSEHSNIFLKLRAILIVMADLVTHGWKIHLKDKKTMDINNDNKILFEEPEIIESNQSKSEIRRKIKDSLMIGVKKQIESPGTSTFIRKMHSRTRTTKSIDCLIDEPTELIKALTEKSQSSNDHLKKIIDPYIQPVDSKTRDAFTNLRLSDVWKYFRHTWSLEYKTNPGRSMGFLIRNRARRNHPIIGISMLASPVLGLTARDKEIMLTTDSFLKWTINKKIKMSDLISMIQKDIARSLRFVKSDDLLTKKEILNPNKDVIKKLSHFHSQATIQKDKFDKSGSSIGADRQLFIAKRAFKLKQLLERKIDLWELKKDVKKFNLSLKDCHQNKNFLKIIGAFVTSKRTEIMSSDVMDMSVCGAVEPYNKLIGGKLVALLMASKEAYSFFEQKYSNSENEIATKVAGRKIRKKSDLKCITTTSIYGTNSSQYNRLKLMLGPTSNRRTLEYKKLKDKSEGYGTLHFSPETMKVLDAHLNTRGKKSRINYKFGEGTSPRLRRLRESMSYLGFKSDAFFMHKQERIVYLLNLYGSSLPDKIYGLKDKNPLLFSTSQISKAWRKRWLEQRIQNPEVQKSMKQARKEECYLIHRLPTSKQDLFNKKEK